MKTGKTVLVASAVAASFLLTACEERLQGSYVRAEYRAEPSEVQHDLFFQPGSSKLAAGEADRLNKKLRALILRPNDDILFHIAPSGSETLDARRIATARSTVSWTPARVRFISAPGFNLEDMSPNAALVQVMRYSKTVVECPNQGIDFNDDAWGRREILVGCSNAINIANMVDEQRDLHAPEGLGSTSADAELIAVEKYRTRKTTDHSVEFNWN